MVYWKQYAARMESPAKAFGGAETGWLRKHWQASGAVAGFVWRECPKRKRRAGVHVLAGLSRKCRSAALAADERIRGRYRLAHGVHGEDERYRLKT